MNKYIKEARKTRNKSAKEFREFNACVKKKAFETLEEAAAHKGQRAYKCPHCHKYHRASLLENKIKSIRHGHN